MNDLISRGALRRTYMSKGKNKLRLATVINELEMAPSVDPESMRPHGRWKRKENGYVCLYVCSKCCGEIIYNSFGRWVSLAFCPQCGAKMDQPEPQEEG